MDVLLGNLISSGFKFRSYDRLNCVEYYINNNLTLRAHYQKTDREKILVKIEIF